MLHVISEKISKGKLLTVKVEIEHKIKHVQILGDFFAHPEECIADIETRFQNLEIDFDEDQKITELEDLVKRRDYLLIGVDIKSIVNLIKRALI